MKHWENMGSSGPSVHCSLSSLALACSGGFGLRGGRCLPEQAGAAHIPLPPGGSNDIVGRQIAAKLSERLGKQVVVENRGGAGGIIGTEMVAKADPDGYTLLIAAAHHTVYTPLHQKLPYDPMKSFTPIARVGSGPNVLVVHPSVPANSVKELIALAKQKPGQLISQLRASAATSHLAAELFKMMAGIDFKIVQFKGGGPAMIDLLGGHSHAMIGSLIAALPHIKSGKLRVLGTGGVKRSVDPARCADHRGGRRARVRSDQLVGDPRAGRHTAADRRPAEQGTQGNSGHG